MFHLDIQAIDELSDSPDELSDFEPSHLAICAADSCNKVVPKRMSMRFDELFSADDAQILRIGPATKVKPIGRLCLPTISNRDKDKQNTEHVQFFQNNRNESEQQSTAQV